MKKIFLLFAILMIAVVAKAQTVVSASVEFNYCFTTYSYDTLTVGCHFPYMWNGQSLSADGDYTATLTNSHDCDSIAHMHFITASWDNATDLGTIEICKGKSYQWTDATSQKGDTAITTAGDYTRVFTNARGCDSTVTLSTTMVDCVPEGALAGVFSISDDNGATVRQVYFAKGNLQYKTGEGFRLAEHQWDKVGGYNNTNWVDLFSWGSGKDPLRTSVTTSEQAYNFYDWGDEAIADAGPTGSWFTMTYDEWVYLFSTRSHANDLRGPARVHNVQGYLILPDNWPLNASNYPLLPNSNTPFLTNKSHANNTTFTDEEWEAVEAAGAVFLPQAGSVQSGSYSDYSSYYWLQESSGFSAYVATVTISSCSLSSTAHKSTLCAVRLVQVKP